MSSSDQASRTTLVVELLGSLRGQVALARDTLDRAIARGDVEPEIIRRCREDLKRAQATLRGARAMLAVFGGEALDAKDTHMLAPLVSCPNPDDPSRCRAAPGHAHGAPAAADIDWAG